VLRQLRREILVSTKSQNNGGNEREENDEEYRQRNSQLRPDRRSFQHVIALPDNGRVPSLNWLPDYPSHHQTARAKPPPRS